MNPIETFEVGIAPDHIPALVAVLLLPVIALVAPRLRTSPLPAGLGMRTSSKRSLTGYDRLAVWLMAISAAVHIALPLGHHDRPVLVIGFLADGIAFAWIALRIVDGRSWRLWGGALCAISVFAYGLVSVSGTEEADQVGLITVVIELAALGLCLIPPREPHRRRRLARFAGSTAMILATLIVGTMVWAGTFAAHNASNTDAPGEAAATGLDHDHLHSHTRASRAQAGVVMRESSGVGATAAQQQAADALAAEVVRGTARFADLDVALAAGYALPAVGQGTAVHLENKAYKNDGRVLDPERPETLVYAISGGKATLLGALFVMEKAGQPGPAVGGPITHWHAHNLCVTGLPIGFGVVSPFGSCPALSVNITTPEMMHVWVVDNPNGPFADGLDDTWVRAYHAQHGVAYGRR